MIIRFMRDIKSFLKLCIFLLALCVPFCQTYAMNIEEVTSPKGIKAWLLQDWSVPVITLSFAFRHAGAAYDPAAKVGLAHLVASTLDEGAGDLNAEAFQAALEDDAISLSYSADRDELRGELKTLSVNRTRAAELLHLSLNQPRFDAKDVKRVAEQIVSDLQYQVMDPGWVAYRTANNTVLAGHPYHQPSQGTVKTLRGLKPDDLRGYTKQYLTRDQLVIGVAGDITDTELGAWLDNMFGDLPQKSEKPAPKLPSVQLQAVGKTYIVTRNVPQSKVVMVEQGIKREDPAWYAGSIMNYVLGGGGFNSRLMHEVREKRGLTYGVDTQMSNYDYADMITVGAATSNDSTAQAISVIKEEWAKMASGGITADELQDAKTYLTGILPLSLTSTDKIAGFIVKMQLDHLPRSYPEDRAAALNAVTLDDVSQLAKRLLKSENLTTIIVGSPTNIPNAIELPDPGPIVLGK